MFFRLFSRSGLAILLSRGILCGTPFSGGVFVSLATEQRNATCGNRASARSRDIPAAMPRGLLKKQNLYRQVKFFATE
ncbi:MAG: hypothetical protein II943_03515, partial [Victivallales bacterium]|nr:hypothetical protein [Victivallales bacterium]